MALPGITKVRAQARETDALLLVERQRLTERVHALADTTVNGLLIDAKQASALATHATEVAVLQRRSDHLWGEIAFMEET